MKNYYKSVLIGMTLLLLLWANISYAKVHIAPIIMVQAQQDSNFYRTEINEREVITYRVTPGISVVRKTPKSNIYLNYHLTYNNYDYKDPARTPEEAARDRDSFTEHALTAELDYLLKYNITPKLAASYFKTIDEAYGDALSNTLDRREYDIYRIKSLINAEFFPKLPIELGYRYSNLNFKDPQYQDSEENRLMIDAYYKLKNSFFEPFGEYIPIGLQYYHWWTTYSSGEGYYNSSDYQSDQYRLTTQLKWDNWDLILDGAIGYQLRYFDDNSQEDLDTISYSLSLKTGEAIEFFGRPKRRGQVEAKWIRNLNTTDGGDGYFTADRFSLNARSDFFKFLEGALEGVWQHSKYEAGVYSGREDDLYRISAILGLKYVFKVKFLEAIPLTFGIKGGYEWRDSNWNQGQPPNYQGFDFDNTYIAGILTADWDTAASIFKGLGVYPDIDTD